MGAATRRAAVPPVPPRRRISCLARGRRPPHGRALRPRALSRPRGVARGALELRLEGGDLGVAGEGLERRGGAGRRLGEREGHLPVVEARVLRPLSLRRGVRGFGRARAVAGSARTSDCVAACGSGFFRRFFVLCDAPATGRRVAASGGGRPRAAGGAPEPRSARRARSPSRRRGAAPRRPGTRRTKRKYRLSGETSAARASTWRLRAAVRARCLLAVVPMPTKGWRMRWSRTARPAVCGAQVRLGAAELSLFFEGMLPSNQCQQL